MSSMHHHAGRTTTNTQRIWFVSRRESITNRNQHLFKLTGELVCAPLHSFAWNIQFSKEKKIELTARQNDISQAHFTSHTTNAITRQTK